MNYIYLSRCEPQNCIHHFIEMKNQDIKWINICAHLFVYTLCIAYSMQISKHRLQIVAFYIFIYEKILNLWFCHREHFVSSCVCECGVDAYAVAVLRIRLLNSFHSVLYCILVALHSIIRQIVYNKMNGINWKNFFDKMNTFNMKHALLDRWIKCNIILHCYIKSDKSSHFLHSVMHTTADTEHIQILSIQ